jgi:hypothetical protein
MGTLSRLILNTAARAPEISIGRRYAQHTGNCNAEYFFIARTPIALQGQFSLNTNLRRLWPRPSNHPFVLHREAAGAKNVFHTSTKWELELFYVQQRVVPAA